MNNALIGACCFVLVSSAARGAPLTAAEILNRVADTYRGLQTYEFVATRTTELSAGGVQRSGESHIALAAVKPGKYRLTMKDDQKELIVVTDGETTWTYAPKMKQYTKQQVAVSEDSDEEGGDQDQADTLTSTLRSLVGIYENMARYGPVATLAKEDKIKAGGDRIDCYVVQLKTAKSQHQLWIDKQRFLVLRHNEVAQTSVNGVAAALHTNTVWKQAEIGRPPDNGLFSFDPPSTAAEVPTLNLPGERVLLTGKRAIDFDLKDTQGNQVRLSDYRGKIVLLDFWATWCPPCRKELPSIEKLNRQFRDSDLVVLGINDEDSGTVRGFLKKNEYTLTTLMDSKKSVHRMYGARTIPTVIVIDRTGVIKAHYVGARSEQELLAALKTAGL
jgi:peroxiredoxin/outer membrane lipoprotein-sorting protein